MKKVVVAAIAALALAAPAVADSDFKDTVGENPAEADIASIHVTNSPTIGTVTFEVTLANLPTLTDDADVGILVDADQNATTGSPTLAGADFLFDVETSGYTWEKWDATAQKFADDPSNVIVNYNNNVLTVTLSTTDLGVTTALNFAALSIKGTDPNIVVDLAPDSGPLFTYTLVQAPVAVTVSSTSSSFAGTPKAGKSFHATSLSVDLSNGTTVKAKAMKCGAKLGAVALKGTGAGGCTFALPKTAKGKKLTVRVSGTYNGLPVASSTTFRVG